MTVLTASNLRKRFRSREVVHDVSLDIRQGEIMGLLGPNGAGKTTTFYMLTGIVKPSSGRVRLGDLEITDLPLYRRARLGLSYLPQESSVFKKLTVRQNMQIIMEQSGLDKAAQKAKTASLLEEFGLSRHQATRANFLSGGERRRLEIARCLIRDPQFILLDEPFAGIDPLAVLDIQGLIRDLKTRGIGVLISDHNVRETLNICDRVALMFEGRLVLTGTPAEIVQSELARSVYLGEGFQMNWPSLE